VVAATVLLGDGCIGGGSSEDDSPGGPTINHAPTISGTPDHAVRVDEDYDFRPSAFDPDGDTLTFSIQNRPIWASFDSEDGRLYGTPDAASIGFFDGIVISVSDGSGSDSLSPFSIAVDSLAQGSATISWTPPTTNGDGSALTDLAGYRIYYGRSAGNLEEVVTINTPGITRWVVDNLSPATWYFRMTSFNESGIESMHTPVGSKTIS
jgi:hypothetical protein